MMVYLLYYEYLDGWKELQAIFSTEEKAENFNERENGGHGQISKFELDGEEGEIFG